MRKFMVGVVAGFTLSAVLTWAQTAAVDPCQTVKNRLFQYAGLIANLQVELDEARAKVPAPPTPTPPAQPAVPSPPPGSR